MRNINERITYYATKYGSKAKTERGQLRAAVEMLRARRRVALAAMAEPTQQPRSEFTQDERDIRRASADPRFRKSFLLMLRASERNLLSQPEPTLQACTAWAEGTWTAPGGAVRDDRFSEHFRVARLIAALGAKSKLPAVPSRVPACAVMLVPDYKLARKAGYAGSTAGLNSTVKPVVHRSLHIHTPGETEWEYGRPKRYTRAQNDNHIRCFAIVDGQTAHLAHHTKEWSVTLPAGIRWGADQHGIYAQAGPDEYHPTVAELARKDSAEYISVQVHEYAARRKAVSAEALAAGCDAADLWVCAADSIRGGNCMAGTTVWANSHGLTVGRHYPASVLLRLANSDDLGRVRLAVIAAARQSKIDIGRGYCVLAEHRAR